MAAIRRIVRAGALAAGNVVEVDGERFEIVSAPFLGRSGSSVFDEFRLFWRAQMRPVADPAWTQYGTWGVDEDVVVVCGFARRAQGAEVLSECGEQRHADHPRSCPDVARGPYPGAPNALGVPDLLGEIDAVVAASAGDKRKGLGSDTSAVGR
jgi:hypothetical protein